MLMNRADTPIAQVLSRAVRMVPGACRRPRDCCARIVIQDGEFATENFRETARRISRQIEAHGVRVGTLDVCYLSEGPDSAGEHFLPEEITMLNLIADQIENFIERRRDEEEKERLRERLEEALAQALSDYLPICANCKKIREEGGRWIPVESYIEDHTGAGFTHGICPECARDLYPDLYSPPKNSEKGPGDEGRGKGAPN